MLDLVHTGIYENEELKHWGILGMHWGIRRFQNPDGTLTAEGRERYGVKTVAETKKLSYSKKYESLKNKNNLTSKERKQLEDLEKGRAYLLKNGSTNLALTKLSKENITNGKLATDYLMSTNYGKTTSLYSFLGGAIVSSNYALANENDFLKELKESMSQNNENSVREMMLGNHSTKKTFDQDAKDLGFESALDLIKKKFTKPVTDKDIKENDDLDYEIDKKLLSKYGLKNEDLVMNNEGFIVRKDGHDFDFNYYGEVQHIRSLNSAHKTLMAGGDPIVTASLGALNSKRKNPDSSKSKTEQREDYFSKNYRNLFMEVVNNLEKQGYDVFIDGVDGYAWRKDGGDFIYKGKKYGEVDELVRDILYREFEQKYG